MGQTVGWSGTVAGLRDWDGSLFRGTRRRSAVRCNCLLGAGTHLNNEVLLPEEVREITLLSNHSAVAIVAALVSRIVARPAKYDAVVQQSSSARLYVSNVMRLCSFTELMLPTPGVSQASNACAATSAPKLLSRERQSLGRNRKLIWSHCSPHLCMRVADLKQAPNEAVEKLGGGVLRLNGSKFRARERSTSRMKRRFQQVRDLLDASSRELLNP